MRCLHFAIDGEQSVQKLDSMFSYLLFYRGSAYVETKRYNEAIEYLNLAVVRTGFRGAYEKRAKAYRALGKNDLAEADERLLKP